MKPIKLLLLINLIFILSCKENKIKNDIKMPVKDTKEEIEIQQPKEALSEHEKDFIDTIPLTKNRQSEKLRVLIDGKVYYKKNQIDKRIGDSYYFIDENGRAYDITSGMYMPWSDANHTIARSRYYKDRVVTNIEYWQRTDKKSNVNINGEQYTKLTSNDYPIKNTTYIFRTFDNGLLWYYDIRTGKYVDSLPDGTRVYGVRIKDTKY